MIWVQYFMLFIAFQGMFLSVILMYVAPQNQKLINFLFSGLLVCIAFYILPNCIARFPVDFPRVFLLSNVFVYTFTPIFYLLLQLLFRDSFRLRKKHFLFFLPILIYLIFLLKYFLMPESEILRRLQEGDLIDLSLIDLMTFTYNLFLIFLSWKLYKRHVNELETAQKRAIISFLVIILICNLIWINKALLHLGNVGFEWNMLHETAHWVAFSLLIIFPLTFGLIQSNFFQGLMLKQSLNGLKMSDTEMENAVRAILQLMEEQKPYLDPEFSLTDLSLLTGIKKFQMSRVLNHYMKTPFFKLVSEYRVKELLHRVSIKQNENISLIDIAYHSGFKSKSTFYKVFKEQKGETPKDYLKRINSPYYKS